MIVVPCLPLRGRAYSARGARFRAAVFWFNYLLVFTKHVLKMLIGMAFRSATARSSSSRKCLQQVLQIMKKRCCRTSRRGVGVGASVLAPDAL